MAAAERPLSATVMPAGRGPSLPSQPISKTEQESASVSGPVTDAVWIVLLSAAVSASGLFGRFVADDFVYLENLRAGAPVFYWPEAFSAQLFRPATLLSLYVDWRLFGDWAGGFHLTNALLHIASTVVLWRVVLLVSTSARVSFWTACLFAASASHLEAVLWIAARADLVAAVFTLSALLCILRWNSHGLTRDLIGTLVFLFMALAAKESAAPLPFLLLAVVFKDWWARRATTATFKALAVVLLTSVAFVVVRLAGISSHALVYPDVNLTVEHLLPNLARLLLRTLLPGTPYLAWLFSPVALVAFVAGLAWSIWFAAFRRASAAMLFGIAWVVFLVPVLPLSVSSVSSESDRLLYLPSAFGIAAVTTLAFSLNRTIVTRRLCIAVFVVNVGFAAWIGSRFVTAGDYVYTTAVQLAAIIESRSSPEQLVFITSVADSMEGVPVFRNGFAASVRWYSPTVNPAPLWAISAVRVRGHLAGPAVARTGTDVFIIDTTATPLIHPIADSPFYRVSPVAENQWRLDFLDTVNQGTVVTLSARPEVIGSLSGRGVPFGVVDTGDGTACDRGTMRVAGWALDEENVEVFGDYGNDERMLERRGTASFVEAGGAVDIEQAFPMFTHAATARWELVLACTPAVTGTGVVRILARDADHNETVLGIRRFAGVEFR